MALVKVKKVGSQTLTSMSATTVGDVRSEMNGAVEGMSATVNTSPADDSTVLNDNDIVIFSQKVKGN